MAITATVNTVLCFPAFGSLGFSKVTPAMLSSTAGASGARVYGGAGDWVTGVTGPWGATSFLVSGTQVVGTRQTGFAAATGTAEKGAFATYDAPTAGATYTQAQIQTLMNTVQTLTRQLKALKDAAIAHGLIGT